MPLLTIILPLLAAEASPLAAEGELSVEVRAAELRAHVDRLSSPEFLGRSGPGAARTARHLAGAFARLKLQPAFAGSYLQPIPWLLAGKEGFVGQNVAAILPGADPVLADEWIILSAHYDHLGIRRGKDGIDRMYPGADDNASGVALLLEVAEKFALQPRRPHRTIAFVAFDLEEAGLQGSTHFATHPPRPFKQLKAFLTCDLIGRSMANVMDEYVFVLGSESSAGLRTLLTEETPGPELTVGRLGADLIGSRSDYAAFRDRRVPFLFLTTGQHPDYHKPTDTADKLHYDKLKRIADWTAALLDRLADAEVAPVWDEKASPPDLDEAKTLLAVLDRVLARPRDYPLTEAKRQSVVAVRDRLREIVGRGVVTPSERTWLLWAARGLLATVF